MPGGRPTAYKPENAEIARNACITGATNATLAERFDVSRTTIDNWIASIPDFSEAVRSGREIADGAVVSALYARAKGMERKATRVFCYNGRPVTVDYTEHVLPDVRACIFWLRNRRPEEWRENRPIVDEAETLTWEDLEEASRRVARRSAAEPPNESVDRREADAALAAAAARLHVNL
jgi:hypothetical protein